MTVLKSLLLVILISINSVYANSDMFFWGVSNSAFQVEGNPMDSDWFRWTQTPGKILDKSNADEATDFWNQYERDFRLAKELGANSFRMSIAWERIIPQPGEIDNEALKHYEDIILSMRSYGLEPVITLHHFVLPGWLSDEGGVLSDNFTNRFIEYAIPVVEQLTRGPAKVKYWITFNEPGILMMNSYLSGEWPPGVTGSFNSALNGLYNMSEAHVEFVRELAPSLRSKMQISIAKNWPAFEPADRKLLSKLSAKFIHWFFNTYFMDRIVKGKVRRCWLPTRICKKIKLPNNKPSIDYLGINYYSRGLIKGILKPPFYKTEVGNLPKTDLNWEIYPKGFKNILLQAYNTYGLPIMITENGIADEEDVKRSKFLKAHIKVIDDLISEGIPIFGYLYWSLTDNFEWAHGLKPRFGLVEFNYVTGKYQPRNSYFDYQSLIRSH